MELKFTVNRNLVQIEVDPQKRLLDILREDLSLTGTKEGCGKGECGSCTVFLNSRRVNSCLVPAFQLPNCFVITIEGLQEWPIFQYIEKSFIDHGSVQCGFCIPGYVMSTVALFKEISSPYSQEQIKQAVAGNMCRCTGYTKILEVMQKLQNNKEIIVKINDIFSYE